MKKYFLFLCLVVIVFLFSFSIHAASPSDHGLNEGDLISAIFSDDPDVYIVNEHGYKRLFLNPEIFKFYSHLGGFANVKLVTQEVRDSFPTTGLFRNCEDDDQRVFGIDVEGEDIGQLHWINTTGEQAVQDDPDFFKKVFCINKREFGWYKKAKEFNSVIEVPKYDRVVEVTTTSTQEKIEAKTEFKDIGQAVICHYPPGNPSAFETITVGASAVRAHLEHGDKIGSCINQIIPTFPTSSLLPLALPASVSIPLTPRLASSSLPITQSTTLAPSASSSVPVLNNSVLPNNPVDLSNYAIGSTVDIIWNDKSSNETRFDIQRRTGSSENQPVGDWVTIAQVGAGVSQYKDATLTVTGIYSYRVGACNPSGCAYSRETATSVQIVKSTSTSTALTPTPSTTASFSPTPTPIPASPSIRIISPNGGEQIIRGQNYKFSWEEPSKTVRYFFLYLLNSNGTVVASNFIDFQNSFSGSLRNSPTLTLDWLIPLVISEGSSYKARAIACLDGSVCSSKISDDSDNYFSITTVATSTPATTPTPTPISNDSLPAITAFVKSANELYPTTIYAGLRAYVSIAITDDKGITFGGFNAPGMRYSSADVTLYQCGSGVTNCSEPVYIIVPEQSGELTITVKATDTAGQTATSIVKFTAVGCSTDTECGGSYFPSSGATFCGPFGAALYTQRLKYKVGAVCQSGSCKESTDPGVYEDCGASGKICGFSKANGGQYQCVASPGVSCTPNTAIGSSCQCGPSSYEYYGYCCQNSSNNLYFSVDSCPTATINSQNSLAVVRKLFSGFLKKFFTRPLK